MSERRYIRSDWTIKRFLRHKSDFIVVAGFLAPLLGPPGEILHVLESEGNQEAAGAKYNRVNLLAKDVGSMAKTPLDEWIYFLKNEKIPDTATGLSAEAVQAIIDREAEQ